ncbi:MAG TPA: hypothetical protein VFE38_00155 [Edaphobacter sp.]|nr:hypothetical protein [Edaphobacter sp.]
MRLFATIRGIVFAGAISTMLLPAQTSQQQSPQAAQITYANGQLSVSAHNSSLNEILRDISRHTGMKISGGVTDERVFGQYGPAAPSVVLGQLLDGTGSNMLLLQATATSPAELILTPRNGSPTPPDPNAAREAAMQEPPPQPAYPPARPEYPPASQPEANAPANSSQPVAQPATPEGNTPRTPQQIYQELQRLQQQRQQQTSPK